MCTQPQAIAILGEVVAACRLIYGDTLKDAYLYGSFARGDHHAESDVDIILIVDAEPSRIAGSRRDVAVVSSRLSLAHNVTVSVTVKPYEQFQRFSTVLPFYKNVLQEGIRYAV